MRKRAGFAIIISGLLVVWLFLPRAESFVSPEPRNHSRLSESGVGEVGTPFDSIHTPSRDYIWPTEASRRVTSTFCEFRPTHFHAGIDISTNNRTGYEVFAVRDGYIARVRITPGGYGKMLWLKHDDSFVSAYAHLKSFAREVNQAVRREQHRLERYPIDLTFGPDVFPVKKGDVIAYTGNTGAGGPHLHFEIRDENLNPLNPLLVEQISTIDNVPPTVRAFAVMPLEHNSTVQGKHDPLIFRSFAKQGHVHRIPTKITVTGQIGLGIDAKDGADAIWHRVGIYRLELYLNDSLTFAAQFDRIPASDSKQILLHYDLPLLNNRKGRFQKLYVEQGTTLPIYERRPFAAGVVDADVLPEGEQQFRAVCRDMAGNASEVHGTLIISRQPAIEIVHLDSTEITLQTTNLDSLKQVIVHGRSFGDDSWKSSPHRLSEVMRNGNEVRVHFNVRQHDIIKVEAQNVWGVSSPPAISVVRKPTSGPPQLTLEALPFPHHVQLDVTTPTLFSRQPEVLCLQHNPAETVPLTAVDINHYRGIHLPLDGAHSGYVFRARGEVNGEEIADSIELNVFAIAADQPGWFSAYGGDLVIVYDSGAVFRPLVVSVEREEENGTTVYRLGPSSVLLRKGIQIFIRRLAATSESSMIYVRENAGWELRPTSFHPATNFFSASLIRTLGEFAVLEDTIPPTITSVSVNLRSRRASISCVVDDDLSGIDADEVKMYLNDEFIIPEISESWRVRCESDAPLRKGSHRLKIVAKDRSKNTRVVERTFTVR